MSCVNNRVRIMKERINNELLKRLNNVKNRIFLMHECSNKHIEDVLRIKSNENKKIISCDYWSLNKHNGFNCK